MITEPMYFQVWIGCLCASSNFWGLDENSVRICSAIANNMVKTAAWIPSHLGIQLKFHIRFALVIVRNRLNNCIQMYINFEQIVYVILFFFPNALAHLRVDNETETLLNSNEFYLTLLFRFWFLFQLRML